MGQVRDNMYPTAYCKANLHKWMQIKVRSRGTTRKCELVKSVHLWRQNSETAKELAQKQGCWIWPLSPLYFLELHQLSRISTFLWLLHEPIFHLWHQFSEEIRKGLNQRLNPNICIRSDHTTKKLAQQQGC